MKKFFKQIGSIFTDKEWDADASKIIGFICLVCGIVGFFLGKSDFQYVIGFGAGLLGLAKYTEGV